MVASPEQPYLTPETYLKLEEQSPTKHEYIDGQLYAIAGASDPHVTITLNLAADLRNHRNSEGLWVLQSYTPEEPSFRLESVKFEVSLAALYEDVTFE